MSNTLSARSSAGTVVFDGASLGYGGKPVVGPVNGAVAEGALLALVGPNGAGKSTLLKALAGLHQPISGTIVGAGWAKQPAYVPQHSAIDHAFPMTVLDFVAMGLWREVGFWKPFSQDQMSRSRVALRGVGLDGTDDQRVGTLSGGQLRRALFARASLQDARLILLDEPFAGIDSATAHDLIGMILRWHAEGRTVIAALHDLEQVRMHFPTTLLLARRVVAWGQSREVLTEANLDLARVTYSSAQEGDIRSPGSRDRRFNV